MPKAGNVVPAGMRLPEAAQLQVDESIAGPLINENGVGLEVQPLNLLFSIIDTDPDFYRTVFTDCQSLSS
jgi:hypothetical protein